ncbi:MAG: ACP S-malonyltransferase, partial [Cyanobacteria bacterium J06606_4]
ENKSTSLPVITIVKIDRLMVEPNYRERCVARLVDIVIDIEDYKGARRIFIP